MHEEIKKMYTITFYDWALANFECEWSLSGIFSAEN